MYLQLDPSKTLLAHAIVKILEANGWFYASIISQDNYATDGFMETFYALTADSAKWHVEDSLILEYRKATDTGYVDYKLLNLLENYSRVIVLHCSRQMARTVFQVSRQNGLMGLGYAWFVTDDTITTDTDEDYPVGLLAVSMDYQYDAKRVIHHAVQLLTKATERYVRDYGVDSLQNKSCRSSMSYLMHPDMQYKADLLYR